MKILSRIAVPVLAVWLLAWIVLSWGAIQDDALIHLRYANFLRSTHFITFDGVHASYGTSSLFFVGLLAVLRTFTASPLLSRAVSTAAHLCLFAAFALVYLQTVRRRASPRVQALALATLFLLSLPSAVRWLDDGMETGIVIAFVSLSVWLTHRLSLRVSSGPGFLLLPAALGFLLVIIRNELGIVALFCSAILCVAAADHLPGSWTSRLAAVAPKRSGFLLGGLLAALLVRLVMHHLLPDTALAKSQGIHMFIPSLIAAAKVTGGALLFGIGTLFLWLLSAAIVLAQPATRRLPTLVANLLFPVVLLASALRGQEIQGVRYLVWTFLFSLLWNLLELWRADSLTTPAYAAPHAAPSSAATRPAFVFLAFIALCLLALPMESHLMYRVLITRAHTMRQFMSEDLAHALPGKLGVANDIGYIGFYTHDSICDLEGLVNGRAAASLTEQQRLTACSAQHPDFAFVNASQAVTLSQSLDMSDWIVCGQYDFANMRVPDRHFLIVRPEDAATACRATGFHPAPSSYAYTESSYN